MHEQVALIALVWLGLLLLASIVLLGRRSYLDRVLVLDSVSLLLIATLAVAAYRQGEWYALDAAVVLALLSPVGTLAAVRYHLDRRPLR
jgi:multisubunit Na+/H+ antiporter MnhF subunit